MSNFHILPVTEILPETTEAVTIRFDVPASLTSQFKAIPGQHVKLKTLINDNVVERFYSICQIGDDYVRVGIKTVPEGIFSQHAYSNIKVGDTLEVMAPQGDFRLPIENTEAMENTRNYLFVAAGSGVTPVLSMVTYLLEHTEHTRVDFIYINAKRKTIMFFEQLEALKNRYMDRFSITHVLTREPRDLDILSKRPEGASFGQLVDAFTPAGLIEQSYLCGPLPIIEGFREALIDKGMDKANIHMELFGTPTSQTNKRPIVRDGNAKQITIISGGREQVIDVPQGLNVLDAAIEAGADVPFACKGGVCATCKAKLLVGQAAMDVSYGLEDEEINNDYILTCQAHIQSETAIIDFDVT